MSRGYHHIQEYEKEILEIRISVKYKVIYTLLFYVSSGHL